MRMAIFILDQLSTAELPNEAYKNGRFYQVNLLLDHNQWEGYAYSQLITAANQTMMDAETFFPGRAPSFFAKLFQLYPPGTYNATFWQRVDWFSDVVMDCLPPSSIPLTEKARLTSWQEHRQIAEPTQSSNCDSMPARKSTERRVHSSMTRTLICQGPITILLQKL